MLYSIICSHDKVDSVRTRVYTILTEKRDNAKVIRARVYVYRTRVRKRVPYTTLQNAFTLKYLPIARVTSTCKNSFTFTGNQGNHDSRKKVHIKQTVHESHLIQTCIHGSRLNKKLRSRSRKKNLITNHGLKSSITLHGK